MATATAEKFMTVDEFLALPVEAKKKQQLRRGRYSEFDRPRFRGRVHARLLARVGFLLEHWRQSHSQLPGEVAVGDVTTVLDATSGTVVSIDVAYFEPRATDATVYEGPPLLAVEILSPSNIQDEVMNKVEDYLACNVPLTWVVEPRRRTVTVYRPDAEPVLFNVTQALSGESAPPGFSCPVAEFFR